MSFLLLTGAGFTHNWGGWLGKELDGDLLLRLADDPALRTFLQNSSNFESALESLKSDAERGDAEISARYRRLQTAVAASFREMNLALADRPGIELSQDRALSVQKFLARFDAIFTLNQDLLLELHYDISIDGYPRWHGHCFPGVEAIKPTILERDIVTQRRKVSILDRLHERIQPIYKLHGSADWYDENGDLFVVGGGKESYIQSKPLLVSYFAEFLRCLHEPRARLMIIGYGFRDDHVNEILAESAQKNPSLKVFFVHPEGRDAIHGGYARALPQWTPPLGYLSCIGESRRPLSATLAGDRLEFGKLIRFFENHS